MPLTEDDASQPLQPMVRCVLDDKLSVLDGKLSVLDGKLSVLDGKLSVLDGKLSVLDGKLSVLDGTHRKGDRQGPRSPPYKHDMWTFTPALPEARPLGEHIDSLWSSIRHSEEYLRNLKNDATVDVFLGYRSNVDHAGIEIPHTALDMFIRLEIPIGVSIIIT